MSRDYVNVDGVLYKVGQRVYLLDYLKRSNLKIRTGCVESIGTKYITVKIDWGTTKFDLTNALKEKTEYTAQYILYPSNEAAIDAIEHDELMSLLQRRLDLMRFSKLRPSCTIEALRTACSLLGIGAANNMRKNLEDRYGIKAEPNQGP